MVKDKKLILSQIETGLNIDYKKIVAYYKIFNSVQRGWQDCNDGILM